MTINRQIVESPLVQGEDEQIAYSLDTTPWGGYTSGESVKLFDDTGTDVTATLLSGSASADGDVITTPLVISLVSGTRYKLDILWVYAGNTFEAWAYIQAED